MDTFKKGDRVIISFGSQFGKAGTVYESRDDKGIVLVDFDDLPTRQHIHAFFLRIAPKDKPKENENPT